MTQSLDTFREEAAFAAARASTNRGAALRFFQAEGVDTKDAAALASARARWAQLPLLLAPELHALAARALGEARGRRVDGAERFPAVLWLGGATNTEGGRQFLGTTRQFVKLLEDRSKVVAAKRAGWVIEPTTNPSGERTNAATHAVNALFLDCDGTGSWDVLLAELTALDFSFIAYQSGGWTAESPKWRLVLPLSQRHDTRTEAGQLAWKTVYNHARVVLGALGQLRSVGFDPATETPCCPWFLTEKRAFGDPPRQIVARLEGHTLDLASLALSLPWVADEAEVTSEVSVRQVTERSLDEDKLNEIIDAISAVTNHVPAGRRELYLALPGVLLDRGVSPDDVIAIVEGVSLSYPRRHADKHADNMHCARTTISRWHGKTVYTRIGTLQGTAPLVAAAVDRVLPSAADQITDATRQMLDAVTASIAPAPAAPVAPGPVVLSGAPVVSTTRKRRVKRIGIAKDASRIATSLRAAKKNEQVIAGIAITCFLDGLPLPQSSLDTPATIDSMVATAMRALGRWLPTDTTWAQVLDFSGQTLGLVGIAQSTERVATAERAFYEGQGKRKKSVMKKTATINEQKVKSASFFEQGRKKAESR